MIKVLSILLSGLVISGFSNSMIFAATDNEKTTEIEDGGGINFCGTSNDMLSGLPPQTSKVKQIGGKWYYFEGLGTMATGWINDKGNWYYLNTDGAMAIGWIKDRGKWYFLNSNGSMASNTTIDGYKLEEDGVWIK